MAYSINAFSESLQEMRVKLVATLAHDIRNPLSAAFLAIDVMDYKDGEERFKIIKEMINNNIKRSLGMVEEFS